jgi:6-pyruvoyltetrahydropterin/6-carboxytetrahydropterin synthase
VIELSVQSHLEVAHFMPDFPEGHPNRRVHGHSYNVIVTLRSEEDVAVVMDYDVLKNKVEAVLGEYDHTSVNDWLQGDVPTMENMCRFLWPKFKSALPQLFRLTLFRPTLNMTVVYEGKLS